MIAPRAVLYAYAARVYTLESISASHLWSDCSATSAAQPMPTSSCTYLLVLFARSAHGLASASFPFDQVPHDSRILLWSNASAIFFQSARAPWHASFGSKPRNASGRVIRPSRDELCTKHTVAWYGAILLGGDWTTSGCSIETRARHFEAAGAAVAIFEGTEGLPFDWDGSDTSNIRIAVVVINQLLYKRIAGLVANGTSISSDVLLWLAPEESPLLSDTGFVVFGRSVQALLVVANLVVVAIAVRRLIRHWLARKRHQPTLAIQVVALELCSALFLLVVVIDGPGIEHTRPALFPFFVFRMAIALHLNCQMLAVLLFASYLSSVRTQVQQHIKRRSRSPSVILGQIVSMRLKRVSLRGRRQAAPDTKETLPCEHRMSLSQGPSRHGTKSADQGPVLPAAVANTLPTARPQARKPGSKSAASTATPGSLESKARWVDSLESTWCERRGAGTWIVTILLLFSVFTDFSVSLLESLYIAQEVLGNDITILSIASVSLVMLSIGVWFIWQVHQIMRALSRSGIELSSRCRVATSPIAENMLTRVARILRHARWLGVAMICSIIVSLCGAFNRQLLQEHGGMPYWWGTFPLWCVVNATTLTMSAIPILAFRSPATVTQSPGAIARLTVPAANVARAITARLSSRFSTLARTAPDECGQRRWPESPGIERLSPLGRISILRSARDVMDLRDSGQSSVGQSSTAGSPPMKRNGSHRRPSILGSREC